MQATARLAALVLAAGRSSRAPGFKPLLPLAGSTVIENALACFRRAGVADITVVTGYRAADLAPVLGRLSVRQVFNAGHAEGMFSSVLAGLRALPPETDAFFLLPADMPLVASHTVRLLARAWRKTGAAVVYPVFRGARGHPPLISARLLPVILAVGSRPGGLRPILAEYEPAAGELPVLDEGVLLDIDTVDDYRAVAGRCRHTPSSHVCAAIIKKFNVPESVVRHGAMVAAVAGRLTAHLNGAGLGLDAGLIAAAGLLHDLAKGRPDHASLGARWLRRLGYPRVAMVAGAHTDIAFTAGQPLDEAAVIYLADKLVDQDRIVAVDERFRRALTKLAADDGAQAAVKARLATARTIAGQVEEILGLRLEAAIADIPAPQAAREGR